MLRFLTAGESHGKALVAILEGCPAGLSLSPADIDPQLERRQKGPGRGGRMRVEKDAVEILSGLRRGKTIGSPIAVLIPNRSTEFFEQSFTQLRPGHADLTGAIKYNQRDVRNILERASARETAARVAVGSIARKLLGEFNISITSRIHCVGGMEKADEWQKLIEKAEKDGDTLGGVFELEIKNVPVGLGSHVHYDRRLNANLARAIMSIPAIRGVEFGLGFQAAAMPGSRVHDEIFYSNEKGFYHNTNHAGGIEGGISNGEPIIIRAAMKPISTLRKPLQSVDLATKKSLPAHVERSDVCAVFAAAVIGEAMAAFELANAFVEKFGGDSLGELQENFASYQKRLSVL